MSVEFGIWNVEPGPLQEPGPRNARICTVENLCAHMYRERERERVTERDSERERERETHTERGE